MSISPLLRHSIESWEHAYEHSLHGSDVDRVFAVLHIDQAVELALKEKLRLLNKDIFKSDGTTLSFHETLNSLERSGVSISNKADLQLLHDERNTIQHRGSTIDQTTFEFFFDGVANPFLRTFLHQELGVEPESVLSASLQDHLDRLHTADILRRAQLIREKVRNKWDAIVAKVSAHDPEIAPMLLSVTKDGALKASPSALYITLGYEYNASESSESQKAFTIFNNAENVALIRQAINEICGIDIKVGFAWG